MDVSKVTPDLLTERLDAEFYRPSFLANHRFLVGLDKRTNLGVASTVIKLGYTGPIDDCYTSEGALFLTSKNIVHGCVVVGPNTLRIRFDVHNGKLSSTVAKPGDLLFSRTGSVGKAAVLYDGKDHYNFAAHLFAVRLRSPFDSGYLCAFFNSPYGSLQSERMQRGTIIQGLSIYDMPSMIIPNHSDLVQKYIGDKSRQAERLRADAQKLQKQIDQVVTLGPIQAAMATPNDRTNRVRPGQLEPRLDAKFYSLRAMRIFEAAFACQGVPIAALKPIVSNGFEYRTFVETGRAFATVSQVASRRLDLSGAPRIPATIPVPTRASLTARTILAVRSGATIGTVVKIHEEDCHACACGDFIVLHFATESLAAAVAAWLNTESGRILQDKVIYGGVIPKICQDDLLTLPVPKAVLDAAEQLASWTNAKEQAVRCAQRLVTSAKILVEALIEGRLSESELISAHHALERGEQTLDRAILSRLTEDGIDVAGKPQLFPDLDALYAAIDETQQTQPSNGDAT